MEGQKHGGNVWAYDKKIIDFSASLNPFGMPPEVQQAAIEGVKASIHYPDVRCNALCEAIAQVERVEKEWILCGNGAAELLDRLALALRPRRALLTAPTFGEYARALQMVNCRVMRYYLKRENEYDLTADFLRTLRAPLDLLILCSPNNPTGRTVPAGVFVRVLAWCEEHHTRLLVDESFLDMTDEEYQVDLRPLLAEHPRLILLRSMTKSYCMAGLRLGYLLTSDKALLGRMKSSGQPWNVSIPAQYAGVAALTKCPNWARECMARLRPLREKLRQGLTELGCCVWAGRANYLLFQVESCHDLVERLLKHDILIRSCASFEGLGGDVYRVAVRTAEENQALLDALKVELTQWRKERGLCGKTDNDTGYNLERG